jgi:hypothetical protein
MSKSKTLGSMRQQIKATVNNAHEHTPYAIIEWRDLIAWGHIIDAHLATIQQNVKDTKPRRSWTTEEVLRTASITPGTRGEMLRDYADMLERARSTVMPEDVAYALNRMCTPLDESRLKGVTASEDARCMRVIQEYVESVAPARACRAAFEELRLAASQGVLAGDGRIYFDSGANATRLRKALAAVNTTLPCVAAIRGMMDL